MEKNEVFMKVSNLIKKPKKNYVRAKSKLFRVSLLPLPC